MTRTLAQLAIMACLLFTVMLSACTQGTSREAVKTACTSCPTTMHEASEDARLHALLSKRISLDMQNPRIDDVMQEIERQTGEEISFVAPSDMVIRGTISLKNMAVESAIRHALAQSYDFVVRDGAVCIGKPTVIRWNDPATSRIYDLRQIMMNKNRGAYEQIAFFCRAIIDRTGGEYWHFISMNEDHFIYTNPGIGPSNPNWNARVNAHLGIMLVNQRAEVHEQIESLLRSLSDAERRDTDR